MPPPLSRIRNKCPPRRLPSRQDGVVAMENLRVLSREEKSSTKKVSSPNISFLHLSIFCPSSCVFSLLSFRSELNSHILSPYTYIYSHLFTFLFKIFVYKCVYKLNIISSCPVSKWHLQGKGCVGLRFLIALQEPTKRQHRTLSKCVVEWF